MARSRYAQHEAEAEADQAAFAVGGGGDDIVTEVEALRAEVARLKAAAAAAGSP